MRASASMVRTMRENEPSLRVVRSCASSVAPWMEMRQVKLPPVARISSRKASRAVFAPLVKTTISSKPRPTAWRTTSRNPGWSVGSPPSSVSLRCPSRYAVVMAAIIGATSSGPALPRAVSCPETQNTQRLLHMWPSWISICFFGSTGP